MNSNLYRTRLLFVTLPELVEDEISQKNVLLSLLLFIFFKVIIVLITIFLREHYNLILFL